MMLHYTYQGKLQKKMQKYYKKLQKQCSHELKKMQYNLMIANLNWFISLELEENQQQKLLY